MQTIEKSGHKMTPVIFYRGLGKLTNFPLLLVVSTNTSMVLRLGSPLAIAGPSRLFKAPLASEVLNDTLQ